MRRIEPLNRGPVSRFNPEDAKKRQAQADAIIDYARSIRDWPLLEKAVDQMIKDQAAFVAWWDQNVTPGQSPGRKKNR